MPANKTFSMVFVILSFRQW